MPFLGVQPTDTFASVAKQTITGDGSVTYTLTHSVANANDLAVFVNNVRQEPTVAYSASGTSITFTEAIASTDDCYVVYIARTFQTVTAPDNSVNADQLSYPLTNFSSTGIDDNATSTALTVTDSGIAATLTTAAQPNVTSVGTLSALSVAGDLTVDTNALKVDTVNNRVGVGTQSPTALLDVAASLNPTIRLKAGLVGNDPSFDDQYMGGVEWFTNDTSGIGAHVGASIRAFSEATGTSTTPSYALTFSTSLANTVESEAMRITRQGNVGIGKTPVARLDVANGTTYTASGDFLARIQQNTNGTGKNGLSVMNAWAATNSTIFECAMGWDGASTGYYPVFKIDGTGQAIFSPQRSEAMRIDTNGNLLVGTTSFGGFKQKVVQSTNLGVCALHNTLTSGLTYDQLQVLTDHASSTAFHLMRCYVSGGSNVQFAVRGDGVIFAQNTAVQSLSDARVKENVRDSEQGLDVITALRPVRFDFKEGFGNNQKNQLGFIAQEVEAVFPDAVMEASEKTEREEPLKSLGPAALIPVMVKAIQEQQAIIEDLQTRLSALEAN